jgi:ribonucleotide monophosphatase NagD (HAD superfamily)
MTSTEAGAERSADAGHGLRVSDEALSERYDVAMLDLDGVVYIGADAVPGAADRLAEAASAGMHLAYVTNNASRTPATVA